MSNLILVRGLPGSGKTLLTSLLIGERDFEVCADDYFYTLTNGYQFNSSKLNKVHEYCQSAVEDALIDGCDNIFVHGTFTTKGEMKPYFELAKRYNATVLTIIVENRHGNKSVHNVPDETIEKMKYRFDIKL